MDVQLTTLDLYANGFQQMLPVLVDAYNKAKANNLLEDELNAVQSEALITLPPDLHEVIASIRTLAY
ncbi:MAG: hypothetical protein Q7V63_06990 [Gammaproteobacteria bacterium]|nr:hypothetical protein [Gammaproteobacteria bacterium]